MKPIPLALGAALCLAAACAAPSCGWASEPIGYTAPDGVNTVAVTKINPLPVGDTGAASNNAAFQGAVAMTVGTTYPAQRSIGMAITAAGNVSLTLADASTVVVPVQAGWNQFPFAVTAVNASGTTATGVYSNLK